MAIDRAIYRFDVNEAEQRVRILAIFFGGQDHIRHMLTRLLRPQLQAQALGAALADMPLDKTTRLPVDFLQAWRFAKEAIGL